MKFFKLFLFACILIIGIALSACDDVDSTDDTDDSDGTSSSSTTVSLTGTLSTGTISGSYFKNTAAASGYTVAIVDNARNRTYRATTESDGTFLVDVPADGTYLMSLVNDGSYIGPTVFDGSGTSVTTGITPTAAEDLGAITVDTTNGYARSASAPSSAASAVTATAAAGVPFGAASGGVTVNSGVTNRSDSDIDMDGIPNFFDADEDSDGVRNGIEEEASTTDVVSDYVESVFMSSNIWADHATTDEAKDLIALRLHVTPVEGQEDTIASVQCVDVPSSISSVATIRWAGSLGVAEADYPDERSLWSDSSYNLYEKTDESQWIVSITPKAIMNVGDTFTIRVTYTDDTYEDFFVSTAYVLTDWAKITSYNSGTDNMPTDSGTSLTPVSITGTTLEVTFKKPLDEDGNVLEGLTYSVSYGASTASDEGRYTVPSSGTTTVTVTDVSGATTLTTTITGLTSDTTYYIVPVAESSDGQRNGAETWWTVQ